MSVADERPKSYRTLVFLLLLLAVIAGLGYSQGFLRLPGAYGASVLLLNETTGPITDVVLSYPGGKIELARIEADGSVGSPIHPETRTFDVTLAFKGAGGQPVEKTVTARVVDDLLIELYVLPLLERATVTTEDGEDVDVVKVLDSGARLLVSYGGERDVDR